MPLTVIDPGVRGLQWLLGLSLFWLSWQIACWLLWHTGFWLLWRVPACCESAPNTPAGPRGPLVPEPGSPPLVSIIIPARNEEGRLPHLLKSLVVQTRPADEVIVVDDHSSDATAAIAAASNATVISPGDLPVGWTGKSWACWTGALASTGSVLVFLDADTVLARDGLARLVAEHRRGGGLLTVQPYHTVVRMYEHLSAIFNLVLMMGMNAFTPLGERIGPNGAFGPCMVCSRDNYFRSGGHRRVRGAILEDFFLGRSFMELGEPVYCLGGRGAVSFRMYPEGIGQLVEGWSKTLGHGGTGTNVPTLFLVILWVSGCFATTLTLPAALLQANLVENPTPVALAAILYVAYAGQIYWMLSRIGNFGFWTAAFFPIFLYFFIAILARSLTLAFTKRSVRWKGRDIPTRSFEEPHWA